MSDVVIRAEGLGKKYLIGRRQAHRTVLRDVVTRAFKGVASSAFDILRGRQRMVDDATEEFWALKDVDFEIKRGDVVGIIGRNGAGKSTLLKVLSRITEPSQGRVEIRGRVASLLEVGTGFHPELTGRENIFLNGAILGMSRLEIRQKFDEIVAFAEVEQFLDTPVKRYSSGMYVRLAFAVAAHLEPEILVVDEVLAVGDMEFQKKCLGKMHDVAGKGRTVLFVSHNMGAVRQLCERGILMSRGNLTADADISTVIDAYQQQYVKASDFSLRCGSMRFESFTTGVDQDNGRIKMSIAFSLSQSEIVEDFCLLLYSTNGVRLAIADLSRTLALPTQLGPGDYEIECSFGPLMLVDGVYDIGLYLKTGSFTDSILGCAQVSWKPVLHEGVSYRYPSQHRGYFETEVKGTITPRNRD
ncbi:MAG: ABC transporter ATP-binding protein [Pseudomonadota bacterium]